MPRIAVPNSIRSVAVTLTLVDLLYLSNNQKPGPITEEERTIITDENRRLIEQSAQIIAWGIAKGWIAYPEPIERRIWKIPQLSHPPGSSIDPTLES